MTGPKEKEVIYYDIGFTAKVNVKQTICIHEDKITPEALVEGLKEGKCFTTINYSIMSPFSEIVTFDDLGNEVKLALVVSQEEQPGAEYSGHTLLGESTLDVKINSF